MKKALTVALVSTLAVSLTALPAMARPHQGPPPPRFHHHRAPFFPAPLVVPAPVYTAPVVYQQPAQVVYSPAPVVTTTYAAPAPVAAGEQPLGQLRHAGLALDGPALRPAGVGQGAVGVPQIGRAHV